MRVSAVGHTRIALLWREFTPARELSRPVEAKCLSLLARPLPPPSCVVNELGVDVAVCSGIVTAVDGSWWRCRCGLRQRCWYDSVVEKQGILFDCRCLLDIRYWSRLTAVDGVGCVAVMT